MSLSMGSSSGKGGGLTLLELKMRARAREEEEKARAARKRNVIVLIMDYLQKNGYTDSLERLSTESSLSLSRWHAADNIDLSFILQEFEQFYELKYGRAPRIVRPATTAEEAEENEKSSKHGKRKTAPLPPLPSGVGSTPSAIPAAYRGAHLANDAYQGNPGYGSDMLNGNEGVGGASTSGSSGGGAAAGSAISAVRDRQRAGSAKEQRPSKDARSQTAHGGGASREKKGDRSRTAERDRRVERERPASSSLDFGIQGSGGIVGVGSGGGAHASAAAASNVSSSSSSAAATPVASSGGGSNGASSSSSSTMNHSGSSRFSRNPSNIRGSGNGPISSPHRAETPDSEMDGGGGGLDDGGGQHASYFETRILKPMPEYADPQFRELAHVITRDIYSENPNVRWSDIIELDEAKQLLQEAIVMPLRFPQFFTGLLSPWKGVLLYGPPGTGKTMLARAVATECRTTFFNISASSIVSKYRGDSEKLVRVLFELARYHAPSTIFIDEIDSIMGRRDAAGEHEGSRRMKTELLVQMDGLAKSDDLVFVLTASNLPWDLDTALLRRLEKRILVPLPNEDARRQLLSTHLQDGVRSHGVDFDSLAKRTDGYSGSDLVLLCKEAAMRPVRRLMQRLMSKDHREDEEVDSEVKLDPVVEADVMQALACTRPSAQSKFLEKYGEWHRDFGAGIHDVSMEPSPSP